MGDYSSACLMQQQQPFCYASGFPKEANKSNLDHAALGQSVSFGRFMSDSSLAWEKFSSFSQNRYVEEAERFTRRGSVAQKKAFFEAHYKRLAAQKEAALLEQATSASSNSNSVMTSPKSKVLYHEENALVLNSEPDATTYDSNSNIEGAQPETNHKAFAVKLQNHLEKVDDFKEPSEEGRNFDQGILRSRSQKKQLVSSFKMMFKVIGTSSTPMKSTTSSSLSNKDDIATPMSNKPSKSTATKSPHKSLNLTIIREINRLRVSLVRKFECAGVVGASSSKASKDSSTLLRTTTKDSKNELQKHSSFSPLTETQRSKSTIPIIYSPFRLSTKERASSRNKKLEREFNASEAQKVQLHTKYKDEAETKIRKLRQSFCFKARSSSPDFYQDTEASKRGTKKDRLTPPESPKQGIRRATLSAVESKSSLPRNRPFKGKNCGMTLPLNSNSSIITTHENTSPNIQHGNQIHRN